MRMRWRYYRRICSYLYLAEDVRPQLIAPSVIYDLLTRQAACRIGQGAFLVPLTSIWKAVPQTVIMTESLHAPPTE